MTPRRYSGSATDSAPGQSKKLLLALAQAAALARLTRADVHAGYVYELAFRQFEVSDTRVFDRPAAGRSFFEQLIRDHVDVGRPESVSLIFDRRIGRRTPGTWRTRVITKGVDPQISCYYRSSRIEQYFKEHRALRTETVICNTRDFGIGRRVTAENWKALRAVGRESQPAAVRRASRRCPTPLRMWPPSAQVTRPSQIDGQHAPGLPFEDARVMAVLAAIVGFTHLLAGFDNPGLVRAVTTLLGCPYTSRQATYDLRRLQTQGAHRQDCQAITATNSPRWAAASRCCSPRCTGASCTRLGRVRPKARNRSREPQRSGTRLAPTRPTPESIYQRSAHRSLNPNLV